MIPIHIDFESYSEADLKDVGAWAYSKHPSTLVLCMAYALGGEDPRVWIPGEPLPDFVKAIHKKPDASEYVIHCWNDFFEVSLWANVLKWPLPPPQFWADTAAKAAVLALPRSLEGCGQALGLGSDAAKHKDGKTLMQIFSKPKKSLKKENRGQLVRTLPHQAPAEFKKYVAYCKQDVVAERTIDKLLPALHERTRSLWELDRTINLRGVYFDKEAVQNAIVTRDKAQADIITTIDEETAGLLDNISSRDQFLEYVNSLGYHLENAQKEYLKRELIKLEASGEHANVASIIRLRLEISRSSLAKYDKLLEIIDDQSRACGLLRFHGASTGRWSGNLFQPQNLPRGALYDPDLCIELLKHHDPEVLKLFFMEEPLEAISLSLRGMICAPTGRRLIVSDFSQIESRILAWLVGAVDKLEAYRQKQDIYKIGAAAAYKVKYDDVTKEQRQIGKVIELACGYQGGVGAFKSMADVYGVVISDTEAQKLIAAWRLGNPKISSFWHNIEAAAVKAVAEPGSMQSVRGVRFKVQGSGLGAFLFCYLPSGRRIAYHRPHLVDGNFDRQQVEYWGVDSVTHKYAKQRTYGGKLVENITQAVAMDCMSDKMLELDGAGYPLILTVHDEIVAEVEKGKGSLAEFNSVMEKVPVWAEGLPMAADGYEAKRYKK